MTDRLPLLAVPNVSEGRAGNTLDHIGAAFVAGGEVRLLDRHSDADHHRAVFTLAGAPGAVAGALVGGAGEVVRLIELKAPFGQHPHVGALDVAPVVYLERESRGAACAAALVVADRIGEELGVPVFLYGELADGRTRASLRRGGREGLAARIRTGELRPDFGPPEMHPTAGATLVAAREPLVAFNVELAAPSTLADAQRIAGLVREGGEEGLPGLRAIGIALSAPTQRKGASTERPDQTAGYVAQVSMNVERPLELPLRVVIEAIGRHAEVVAGELVGLAPRAAFAGFPADIPMRAFDPARQLIENALG